MALDLPPSLETYFAAANGDDPDRVADCFTATALVHDERRDIRGREAIRAWAAETRRKYRFHAEVLAVDKDAGRIVTTARLTGDFPGSPVVLRYRFKLAGGKIDALEIG